MSAAPSCPFCGAGTVERVAQWGGQIITSQWRCEACNSYFEALREEFDDVGDARAPPRRPSEASRDDASMRPCASRTRA